MAITNGYATLAQIKGRLDIDDSDTDDDTTLELLVQTVSRWIDEYCGRRFYAATQTRYYQAEDTDLLFVDDLLSVTTLKTDDDADRVYETTWGTDDYDLEPENAATDGKPYTRIRIAPLGSYSFPTHRRGVQLAGSFGYASSTPDGIREACLLQCERLFKRGDAPFGIAGSPEIGQMTAITKLDPDVKNLLTPFVKAGVVAI